MGPNTPKHLDLKKDRGLTVQWADGSGSYYPLAYLRRMSPSADQRELRRQMATNPLTVLPRGAGGGGELTVSHAELVGNYAIKIEFSDGHRTAIYSWEYLRSIDPARRRPGDGPEAQASAHDDPLALGPRRGATDRGG